MIPEAWQNQRRGMSYEKRAFYEWAACLMEPWDGPALFTFADGRYIGATLDRNGLRPCRFYVTKSGQMICASEVGTIAIPSSEIVSKGRLQPGKMLLVDTERGIIVDDTDLKEEVCSAMPYRSWLDSRLITMENVRRSYFIKNSGFVGNFLDSSPIHHDKRMLIFGFRYA